MQNRSARILPLGGGSCFRRTRHPFTVSGQRPSQKIECVFSASPETVRREPREFHLRCSVGQWRDLAVCALCVVLFYSLAWFSDGVASAIFCRHEIPLSSIYGEKICDHLARYRKRRSIGVPFLFLSFIEQRKIVILSGRQLRSLDQHKLDILVALFGNRCAHRLLG
jgi:hypothetical protein